MRFIEEFINKTLATINECTESKAVVYAVYSAVQYLKGEHREIIRLLTRKAEYNGFTSG